jgi:methyltransferase (TIGR00027 family)
MAGLRTSGTARLIEDVSDTARWVAYHRAIESERPDALFRDPFARRLAGERGRRIAEGMPTLRFSHPGARGIAWALAVRTKVIDDLVLESIGSTGASAVLNLAAGLDTRPYRLPLPPALVWIEADRAPILAAKTEVLAESAPACVVERVDVDLADGGARGELFDRVAARHERVVVLTEGLLVYLDENLVGSLAGALRARPSMQRWILDNITPESLAQNMQAWGATLAEAHAEWKFAPSSGLDFFRPHGWSPVVVRSCVAEARRLGRYEMRSAWLLRAFARLSPSFRARIEGLVVYAVLERT